jgi:hypothetical protein
MRAFDLIRPYVDGLRRVVDAGATGVDIVGLLRLPEGVTVVPADAEAVSPPGAGTLLYLETDTDASGVEAALGRLTPGAIALLLLGWEGEELLYHRLLDAVSAAQCQVLQYASLQDESRGGIVVARTDRMLAVRSAVGGPAPASADPGSPASPAMARRMASEYVFGEVLLRQRDERLNAHRERVDGLATDLRELTERLKAAETRLTAATDRAEEAERDLADTRARLEEPAEVGRLFIAAARDPGRRTLGIGRLMLRYWSTRPRPRAGRARHLAGSPPTRGRPGRAPTR